MKPIAIIAIIAAVVVVGGACAGVAFSGVLNGGTTGPGGDDPVVPTDPVDPTPTETPTETPTPTPTDSSMSYFSPMTSSGSSSKPSHTHTYSDEWSKDETNHWYDATCGHDLKKDVAIHEITNGICGVCGYGAVALVDETYYGTLEEAINAAETGETVTLLADVTIEAGPENNIVIDKAITIDGNGKTITRSFNDVVNSEGYGDYEAVFKVTTQGVTIKNVNFKQATVANKDEAFIYVATGSNTLTVSGNTFTGMENSGLTGVNTEAAISDITISNNEFSSVKYAAYFNNVDAAVVSSNTVTGTQYNAFNLADGTATFTDNTLTQIATADYSDLEYNSGIAVCGAAVATITGGSIELDNENGVDIFAGVNIGDAYYGPGVTSISLYTAEDMVAFAKSVNEGGNTYAGKTVKLMADIDLTGIDWTPIGQTGATQFQGTFDGNDKTISNLNVDTTNTQGQEHYSSGLFGWLNAGTVKNLTIDNADITALRRAGAVAGYLEGEATVENCKVTNSKITGKHVGESNDNNDCGDKVGAVVGLMNANTYVKNCTAEDCTIIAGRDAGCIVGAGYTAVVTDCSFERVTVTSGSSICKGGNLYEAVIGRVLG